MSYGNWLAMYKVWYTWIFRHWIRIRLQTWIWACNGVSIDDFYTKLIIIIDPLVFKQPDGKMSLVPIAYTCLCSLWKITFWYQRSCNSNNELSHLPRCCDCVPFHHCVEVHVPSVQKKRSRVQWKPENNDEYLFFLLHEISASLTAFNLGSFNCPYFLSSWRPIWNSVFLFSKQQISSNYCNGLSALTVLQHQCL